MALPPRPSVAGESCRQLLEQRLAQAIGQEPHRLAAAGRLHEGCRTQPRAAVMAECDRALADGCPHAAADRLQAEQAEAVLVGRPDLDGPGCAPVVPSLVAQSLEAAHAVARGQLLHPPRRERQHTGNVQHRSPLSQKLARLDVPRLGRVSGPSVEPLQCLDRRVLDDVRHDPAPTSEPPGYPRPDQLITRNSYKEAARTRVRSVQQRLRHGQQWYRGLTSYRTMVTHSAMQC